MSYPPLHDSIHALHTRQLAPTLKESDLFTRRDDMSEATSSLQIRGKRLSRLAAVTIGAFVAFAAGHAAAEHAGLSGGGGPSVDPAIEPYVNHNGLQGKLSIAGSDTMRPLITKLAAQFSSLHPGAQVAVEGTGSSAAIREFLLGLSYQRRGD
ncbi:MAG TPA: hypothetical protein DCQ94_00425, partial [Nitrospira sp.]|nr:hypothetical protein [Nitrospira sp.]